MVKHNTHKRAYNKRRSVRRLKRTLRRTIQKGGSVVPIFIAIATLVAGDKIVNLLKFIQLFTGGGSQSGGGFIDDMKAMARNSNIVNMVNDTGSGFADSLKYKVGNSSLGASISSKGSEIKESAKANVKEQAVAALEKLRESYEKEIPRDDVALNCITQLILKLNDPTVAAQINGTFIAGRSLPAAAAAPDVKSVFVNATTGNFTSEFLASGNKMEFLKTTILGKLDLLKIKVNQYVDKSMVIVKAKTGFDDGDIECIKLLKTKIVNDLTNGIDVKFKNGIEEAKKKFPFFDTVINGASAVKDALTGRLSAFAGNFGVGRGQPL